MEPGDYDVRLAFGEKIIHGNLLSFGALDVFDEQCECKVKSALLSLQGAIPLAVRDGDEEATVQGLYQGIASSE